MSFSMGFSSSSQSLLASLGGLVNSLLATRERRTAAVISAVVTSLASIAFTAYLLHVSPPPSPPQRSQRQQKLTPRSHERKMTRSPSTSIRRTMSGSGGGGGGVGSGGGNGNGGGSGGGKPPANVPQKFVYQHTAIADAETGTTDTMCLVFVGIPGRGESVSHPYQERRSVYDRAVLRVNGDRFCVNQTFTSYA
jgi:hypothetical protein